VTATGQLDPTQVYTTPNIVQPTTAGSGTTPWVGGVYQDQLTCWAWGDPGYCGPNAIVRPGGNINFSFGTTNLYQMQAIASVLPNTGSGLRVNGYNFGFTAKNGNGWDDGRLDYLSAYVSLYDPSGSTVFNKNYDLNSRFNWTTFNYSETFNTPFASKDLGSVQYGFVGRDNNGWAGPYGPEIYNVNFSLKYSADPCSVDVLSSPSCPGYLDALAKLAPPTPTASVVYEAPTTVTSAPIVTTAPSVSSPTTTTAEIVAPAPTSTTSTSGSSTTGAGTPTPTNNSVASATPSATSPQTKVGEVQISSAPAPTQKSSVSTSQILSIVANEQSRIANVEKTVVQEAVQQAQAAGASATSQAESIAASAQAQSIASSGTQQNASSTSQGGSEQRTQAQSFAISPLRDNNPTSLASLNSSREQSLSASGANQSSGETGNASTGIQMGVSSNVFQQNYNRMQDSAPVASIAFPQYIYRMQESPVATVVMPSVTYSLVQPRQTQVEELRSDTIKFGERNIIDMSTQRTQIEDASRQQANSSVNRNAKDNEAADGSKIEDLAQQGANLALYSALKIQDAAFYAPKEIYRNQRVVDNARVMRSLSGGSDRLHQQMVDQQYK
jgi:hypothetical protein